MPPRVWEGLTFPCTLLRKQGDGKTALLVNFHLYSNQGMFSVPYVPKPSGLRASLNGTYCISPEILEESGGRKTKDVLFFFFFNTSYKNIREACKRESRLQKIRCGYRMFCKSGRRSWSTNKEYFLDVFGCQCPVECIQHISRKLDFFLLSRH